MICSIMPAINDHGPGVYAQIAAVIGYGWKDGSFTVGPSLAGYDMPACNEQGCLRIWGISPGALAQLSVYLAGPLGLSASASVNWFDQNNAVLPGGVMATLVAGPVLRWGAQ